jgi:hypothetical protein
LKTFLGCYVDDHGVLSNIPEPRHNKKNIAIYFKDIHRLNLNKNLFTVVSLKLLENICCRFDCRVDCHVGRHVVSCKFGGVLWLPHKNEVGIGKNEVGRWTT